MAINNESPVAATKRSWATRAHFAIRDRNSWIFYCCSLLVLLPKINLIEVGAESAGVRIDDLLVAAFYFCAFLAVIEKKKLVLSSIEKRFYLFVGTSLLSFTINFALFERSSAFYALRIFEYFAFFYVGMHFLKQKSLDKLLHGYILLSLVICFAQHFELVGGFASRGYRADVSERVIGLTGGPWEIGAICNLVVAYFLLGKERAVCKIEWLTICAGAVIIVLTGARTPLFVLISILAVFSLSNFSLRSFLGVVSLGLAGAVVLLLLGETGFERSSELVSMKNLQIIETYLNEVDYKEADVWSNSGAGLEYRWDYSEGYDTSWLARLYKWVYAWKVWFSFALFWAIGVGPGVWGVALDGGWLRVLTEYGVVGLATFLAWMLHMAEKERRLRWVIFVLFANMVFIDIFMSYKFMAVFLLIAGFYSKRRGSNVGYIGSNPGL